MRARIYIALYALGIFLFQEAVFRLVFPLPDAPGLNRMQYMPLGIARIDRHATAVRNIRCRVRSTPDHAEFVNSLNFYGFRGANWPGTAPHGRQRVLFFGDSFIEGHMSPDTHTIPASFEQAAKEAGMEVEGLNFGIAGAGLRESMRILMDAVPVFGPDTVVLALYANDLPDNPPIPEPHRPRMTSRLKPRIFDVLSMWRRREMLSLRWNLRTTDFEAAVPDPNNPWSDPAFEARMSRHTTPEIREAMKRGDFSSYRIGGARSLVEALQTGIDIRYQLGALRDFCRRHSARLLVVYIPERSMVTNHYRRYEEAYSIGLPPTPDMTTPAFQRHRDELAVQCAELDIPFVDCTPWILREESVGHHLYWDYDDHLRPEGYDLLGRKLFRAWTQLPGTGAGVLP